MITGGIARSSSRITANSQPLDLGAITTFARELFVEPTPTAATVDGATASLA